MKRETRARLAALAAAAVLLTAPILAQEPAPEAPQPAPGGPPSVEYSGTPIALPYACAEKDFASAGLTCSPEEPCPVYLELSAVEEAGGRVFLAGNIHSGPATLFGVLLAGEDGGRVWREAHERVPAAALDRIQFSDSDTGWVGGETLVPLVQDPFFLFTPDGGKTWRKRLIFNEEGTVGSILQFRFTTKAEGSLIIDRGRGSRGRYRLYATHDGGATWGVTQETDTPPRLPSPPTPAWRVRADSATDAFQIERRTGERWSLVTAFGVKLAACKGE